LLGQRSRKAAVEMWSKVSMNIVWNTDDIWGGGSEGAFENEFYSLSNDLPILNYGQFLVGSGWLVVFYIKLFPTLLAVSIQYISRSASNVTLYLKSVVWGMEGQMDWIEL
jgi:hypothetical protein